MKVKFTHLSVFALCAALFCSCSMGKFQEVEPTPGSTDLVFNYLPTVWDEAMPLGNAVLGELVWQREDSLRLSLDHTDLWDLRPVPSLHDPEHFNWKWIQEQVVSDNLDAIREKIEDPYSYTTGPSKIPCAAIEFPISSLGVTDSVRLYFHDALCRVKWKSGASMETFINASENVGWFLFNGISDPDFAPSLKVPAYSKGAKISDASNELTLADLGYETGEVTTDKDMILYHQKGWEDFSYDVAIKWKHVGNAICGAWSVSTSLDDKDAAEEARKAFSRGLDKDWAEHLEYWNSFWDASSVTIPDTVMQRQYDSEMYKLGSASRSNSRPISLQAVWTADDGHLPPWKGDYHNDLNTQLSYWPVYVGNHLSEGEAYLNSYFSQMDKFREYTKGVFGVDGIIVPGVSSLDGQPMGGWTQYSLSPTVGAWISQHFYLNWRYSADKDFLREKAYPFTKEVATALEQLSVIDESGHRTLELSTSPEYNENGKNAWFHTITNYDLALMKFAFKAAYEEAQVLGLSDEAKHWKACMSETPDFDVEDGALTIAKGQPFDHSHRHFSNVLAIMPLGLIDISDGEESKELIDKSIAQIEKNGTSLWCGYSFSWMGNLKARALDGDGAAAALKTFAENFVLPNTFHCNGDQSGTGISDFTYRPFTLEGNFAYASGIQEMLLQSHSGVIRVFPAVPSSWKDVSFSHLRTRGAFLVSAKMENGEVTSITVESEKGGYLPLMVPGESEPRIYDTAPGDVIEWMR